jgi:hypothetical protein
MGADEVYFQNPDREAAMLFIIGLAALVRSIIKMRLRSAGEAAGMPPRITSERMFLLVQNVIVRYDREGRRIYLDGTHADRNAAMCFIRALGIDPARLLG